MRQAPAHRPAISDLIMRDVLDCRTKDMSGAMEPLILLDVAPSNLCTQFDTGVVDRDIIEFRNVLEVNEETAGGEAECQHGH
jgi:hypothetical protein